MVFDGADLSGAILGGGPNPLPGPVAVYLSPEPDSHAPGSGAKTSSFLGTTLDGVSKVCRGPRTETVVLDGVGLHVDDGELVCLLGASGCGRSTLLSIIGGLEEPTPGEVRVGGDRVIGPGADRGMGFQGYSRFPWMTVAQDIEFGLRVERLPRARRVARTDELIGIMGLTEFRDATPAQLSGGMRQLVAIARALAPEPDILLLDEPFGALDAQPRHSMQLFLLSVRARTATTVLMVTHDAAEAIYLSNRIYVMATRPSRIAGEVEVPFGNQRGPAILRDPRFVDVRDGLSELLA